MSDTLPLVDKPRAKRGKRERIPVNGNTKNLLTVEGKDPDYYYRWVLDDPDRVSKFKDAAYEFVMQDENLKVGDRKVDTSAGTSSLVEMKAGMGRKYVLMKLPKEFREDDRRAKHRAIDETEAEMQREAKRDRYGKFEIDRSGRSDAPIGS